eukprot:11699482-Alexandrium_andersonii.AAC.1
MHPAPRATLPGLTVSCQSRRVQVRVLGPVALLQVFAASISGGNTLGEARLAARYWAAPARVLL